MDPGRKADGHQRERAALRGALLALLVLAPLPFGSVEPGAVLTLELAASALGAWGISLLLRDPERFPRATQLILALALVPLMVGVLQLLPLPRVLLGALAPRNLEAREALATILPETAASSWPLSLSPPENLDALVRYAAWVLAGIAAAAAFTSRTHLRSAAAALAASGAAQAVYGSAEYLSGHQHIFAYTKLYYTEEATGTIINRNHFAEYLALTLPLALLLVAEGAGGRDRGTWRQSLLRLGQRDGLLPVAGFAAAAAIWIGVLLSYSRGGLAAALFGTALFGWSFARRGVRGIALALVLLLPTSYVLWQEVRAPGERFFDEGSQGLSTLGGRLPVWRETLGIFADSPLSGTGFGTFEAAFTRHRPPDVRNRWDHAHNDWLQSLAEGGLLTALAVLGALALVVQALARPSPFNARPSPAAAALLAALGAAALHGVVDFGLRIPAIALTVAAIAGMTGAVVRREVADRAPIPTTFRWLLRALPALVAALALAVRTAQARPEEWAAGHGAPWLAPPTRTLRETVDRRLEEAVVVLNDTGRAAPERLAGYRDLLRSAERLLVRTLVVNPAQPRSLAQLAEVRFELHPAGVPGDLRGLGAILDLASRTAPTDPDVQSLLGELLLKMGRREKAFPYLRRAAELDSGSVPRLVALLREHLLGAEEIFEALGAGRALLVALRGPYEEDGLLDTYARELETAIAQPTASLLGAYGDACLSLRQPDRVLATLARMGPQSDPILEAERRRQRERALLARGDGLQALEEARATAVLQPGQPSYQEHLGELALAAGEAKEALVAFRKALGLGARASARASWRARLYREIGQAEERASRPDRAFDAYRKALELDPREPYARRRLSEIRRAAGAADAGTAEGR